MARLLIKTEGLEKRTFELRLGVNRIGRDLDCDFPIEHSTVSSAHCELVLSNDGVMIRDCNSTNGTFVNGEPVKEAQLLPGQTVRVGDVELFVENTDVKVSIPKYERERPKPPVVLEDGAMLCPRHPHSQVTYKCTHCKEVMCGSCVRVLQRKGGPLLFLCPLCSHKCKHITGSEKPKKKGFMEFLPVTVKLPFVFFTKGSKTKGSKSGE
jgi:pSer/pThr/pTyr-binding forkhead associated (FHA) protein